MIITPWNKLLKATNWEFCLGSIGSTLGTGLSVMLVGHKKSGKSSMVRQFGLAVERNGKSSYFLACNVFMEMCRQKQINLFCVPDLMVIEDIDWKDDRSIRFAICMAHERRKFKKDTVLCIDASPFNLRAIELLWEGKEYITNPVRCSY